MTAESSETIRVAHTPQDYAAFADLVTQYVEWFRERYRDDASFVSRVFGHQSLEKELQALAAVYGPPNGRTLLADRQGVICGAAAYRHLAVGTCEMKRLFVPSRFTGAGIGRRLCQALIRLAREDGYSMMKLDSSSLLVEAITMYKSMGFRDCAPYHDYPGDLMPYLVFMELPL